MKNLLPLIYIVIIIIIAYYVWTKNLYNIQSLVYSAGNESVNLTKGVIQMANSSLCGVDLESIISQYNIPDTINFENLVKAVIYQESSGNCSAVNPESSNNAQTSYGLMQVTEPIINEQGYTLSQANNSAVNIMIGSTYLGQLLAQNNYNIANALSMYNSGALWDTEYANSVINKYNSLNSTGIAYDDNGNAYTGINCNCN